MSVMDDISDDLAIKALALEERTGDENTVKKIADALASSSPTMEENFLTAVRIRRAERRARRLIEALTQDANAAAGPGNTAQNPAPAGPQAAKQPEQITDKRAAGGPSVTFDTD